MVDHGFSCFKTYDVRGELGINFDTVICYKIGYAFGTFLKAKTTVVGRDARESSPELANSVSQGLIDAGVQVLDIGLCGTEEMYFAVNHFSAGGGIQVTASHNPINFNGLKMVKAESKPLDPDFDLPMIRNLAQKIKFGPRNHLYLKEQVHNESRKAYVEKLVSLVDVSAFKKLKIIVNSGNGAAGPTFDAIEKKLKSMGNPIEFFKVLHGPDSSFPNGIPNPMLTKNHTYTRNCVLDNNADLGIAFDGDFDRCFFFDQKGTYIKGEIIVSLLAELFLTSNKDETIVHDPRIIWNIQESVKSFGGTTAMSKTGHAFVKQIMRESNAVYGGELSAHHYFRDFFYCDSGMLPWLFICELIGRSGKSLSDLVKSKTLLFPSSTEHNFTISHPKETLEKITKFYSKDALKIDYLDGISVTMVDWRFNLRISNTESVVRLNIETRGNQKLLNNKLSEISLLITNGSNGKSL